MKQQRTTLILVHLLFLYLFSIYLSQAQVTIGSLVEARETTVLDLKENNNDDYNSIKGLLYPRVELEQVDMLYPMFPATLDYLSNKTAIDSKHTGLTVYNTSPTPPFDEGIYQWDGERWLSVNKHQLLPAAAGNIDCSGVKLYPEVYTAGQPYKGVLVVPYYNGNGGYYTSATISNNNNFTMKLMPGKLNQGYGELYFEVNSNGPLFSSPKKTKVNISNLIGDVGCQDISVGGENKGIVSKYYKKATKLEAKITGKTRETAYFTIGHLRMTYRYNLSNERIEFGSTVHSRLTYHWVKAGSGGIDYWSGGQIDIKGHSDYEKEMKLFTDGNSQEDSHPLQNVRNLNATNRDIGQAVIILHHPTFVEVFRVSVNVHEKLGATDAGYITIFVEMMD